jgi:hypothetical protein
MDVWVYSVHLSVAKMLEKQGKYQEAIREYEAFIASEGRAIKRSVTPKRASKF